MWNNASYSCQTLKTISVATGQFPKTTTTACEYATVYATSAGLSATDNPVYTWSVQYVTNYGQYYWWGSAVPWTSSGVSQTFMTNLTNYLNNINAAGGASTLILPPETTELVNTNVTLVFTVNMTLGMQYALSTTTLFLQPYPILTVGGYNTSYQVSARNPFVINATTLAADCPAASARGPVAVPATTPINCLLYDGTNTKYLATLPGMCQIGAAQLDMGTNYTLRVGGFISTF